jgi:hypothetical protein
MLACRYIQPDAHVLADFNVVSRMFGPWAAGGAGSAV